jgi:hypothetical protein
VQPLLEPSLQETLHRSLVPSSVQELDRRGVRAVKVLPREAVQQLVEEAAARLAGERVEQERQAARAEILFLTEELERVRIDRAAAERRAEALRLEREAALEEAEAARRGRTDALRQAAEAEEAFQGARRAVIASEAARSALEADLRTERGRTDALEATRAALAAELEAERARLEEAREGFSTQLRAVLADPLAFGARLPERKGHRLARRRSVDAVRRMAGELRLLRQRASRAGPIETTRPPSDAPGARSSEPGPADAPRPPTSPALPAPPAGDRDGARAGARPSAPPPIVPRGTSSDAAAATPASALELVWRRSVGFGLAPRPLDPWVAPAPAAETARAPAPPVAPPTLALDLGPIESRLAAIESKLDRALEARPGAAAAPVDDRGEGDGLASRFGPGTRAGLRKEDPRFHEKNSILRTLFHENVKLRQAIGGTGGN